MDNFYNKTHCDRCGSDLRCEGWSRKFTMSWFTEETICIGRDSCSAKEDEIKTALRDAGKSSMEGCGYVPDVRINSVKYIAKE